MIALLGCSTPYYGYSKDDWNNLSEEERIAIKKEYQFIIEARERQKHEDVIDARTQSVIDLGVEGAK